MHSVLVTGGSRGLGLGIARRLAASGYHVIAVARTESGEFAEARAQLEASNPGALSFRPCDLAEIEKLPGFVSQMRKEFGPLYGLVNNAGISFEGALAIMPSAQIEQLIRVNVLSPIFLTKHVVRGMMADGGGRIVNISSIIASTGYSGLSVYGAAKAAMAGFTRSLAREVGKLGINVNAVAPGFINTDMTKGLSDEQRKRVEGRSALRRLADVEDVANAVEFLLGERSKNITGTTITVDAGNTA